MERTENSATPETIESFVEACKALDSNGIFELFEYGISEALRDDIILQFADLESPEPLRSACFALGQKFGVQCLIDY